MFGGTVTVCAGTVRYLIVIDLRQRKQRSHPLLSLHANSRSFTKYLVSALAIAEIYVRMCTQFRRVWEDALRVSARRCYNPPTAQLWR
jgi:hypothetical protein